ncbi:MAG TPA: glycosyltransferase [Candidatus Aquilonibacter sp.]|nr:glycosyltransferase [Candidatus Aquilonibacter sp.]
MASLEQLAPVNEGKDRDSKNVMVTFVVPCYKLAHLLSECVSSILEQTYGNFEVLIMDNCSPDNTPEVAASFRDARVKHIRNESNIGHLRNFNKGVSMAGGKYVWLLSADDSLKNPQVVQRFVDVAERNPRVGYVFCKAVAVHGSKEVGLASWTDCGNEDRIWDGLAFLRRLVLQNCIVMSGLMVRKDCYDKISLFALDLPHATDWYLWCLFALHYDVAYLSEPMARFRIHEQSLTSSFNRGGSPVCLLDELNVLWRVAREAERVRGVSVRRECNKTIGALAALGLEPGPLGVRRPGLSQAEFDELLKQNAKDKSDEMDVRAHVYAVLGDERYWSGSYGKAAEAYRCLARLRPWSLRAWVKYFLARTGRVGSSLRRFLTSLAVACGLKEQPYPELTTNQETRTAGRGDAAPTK